MNSRDCGAENGEPVIVVGAGIAGLAAAWTVHRRGWAVEVLERSESTLVGGRMATVERAGFHVDLGAPLLAMRYRQMLELIAEAGLTDRLQSADDRVGTVRQGLVHAGRTGTIWRLIKGGALRHVPRTDRVRVLTDCIRYRAGLHPSDMTAAARWDTESVTEYARRRNLDKQTLDCLLDPLATILCLDDPERTSSFASLLFLAFLLSHRGLFTFADGSGVLPQTLAAHLPVTYGTEVVDVSPTRGGGVDLTCRGPDGETTRRVKAVILAVPPPTLAAVCPQLPTALREVFAATRYSRMIQVAFCLDRRTAERAVLLNTSRSESPDIAGFVLQHNLSPHRVAGGRGLVTTYFRGSASERLWGSSDSTIVQRAADTARPLLPETEQSSLAIHVDRISPCVVRRKPGDYRRLARVAGTTGPDRIYWAGGDYLGHSTTIGSLSSGQKVADRLVADLSRSEKWNPSAISIE
jgi:protoporphyrinogen/coproporphyrinogen III oxidase